MQENGDLKYLQWDNLTKWDAEIRGQPKKDPFFKVNKSNLFELEEATVSAPADTGTDQKLTKAF